MKPLIGLIPLWDEMKQSYWMLPGYMKGIERAGGIPVMLPMTDDAAVLDQLADICQGFLLTGGHDVDPRVYGEKRAEACGECCQSRDAMEYGLLSAILERNKPVLGICRGIQFLNAVLGGTLYQDIPSEYPSEVNHHQSPPYDQPCHGVSLIPGSPLSDLLKRQRLSVNSYHHQGIKKLADRLQVMAKADDGLVEAVYMPDRCFVWGVQWHPEFSYEIDADSMRIFEAFVQAAMDRECQVMV